MATSSITKNFISVAPFYSDSNIRYLENVMSDVDI